ncbi:hypothetical protein [Streptomyces sp. NPDC056405]|uniref:hypothetical protein n=1 Tax=Streptomyces sp. NPDC056405 TaxID=3345811 RepID=UPI0035E228B8
MTDTVTPAAHLRAVPDTLDEDDAPAVPAAVDNPALPKPGLVNEKRKPIVAGGVRLRGRALSRSRNSRASRG